MALLLRAYDPKTYFDQFRRLVHQTQRIDHDRNNIITQLATKPVNKNLSSLVILNFFIYLPVTFSQKYAAQLQHSHSTQ
jgi:hypothetical protein